MKTKSMYILALTILFMMASYPLYVAESAEVKKIKGEISGEMICLYEWKTNQEYQGSKAVCIHLHSHQRSLVTADGELYILVADDKASTFVVKALTTDLVERENVIVQGEIVKSEPINIIKVKHIFPDK